MTHNLNLDNKWWFNSESTLEIFIGHTILESKLVNISRFFDNGNGICSEIFASRFLSNLFGWFHTRTRLVSNILLWVFISQSSYQSVTGTDLRLVYESSYFRNVGLPLPLTVEYIISITNMLISVLYSFPFLINLMVSRRFQAFTPVLFL